MIEFEDLSARILYEIESKGLMKTAGKTVDEIQSNIKRARRIVAKLIQEREAYLRRKGLA